MLNPQISIIIPVYNRGDLIGETLDSILAQTFIHWECIVVDDHSTDNTVEVLKSFQLKDARIKWLVRPEDRPKGANACRNCGFEHTKGDYVIFFDSDDLMLPQKLEKSLKAIGANDFVISRSLNFKNQNFFEIPNYPTAEYEFSLPDFFAARVFWITDDALIRKRSVQNIKFDETLNSGQEYNFFCQLLMHTTKGVSLPEVTSHRRLHENSIQASQVKQEVTMHTNRYHCYQKTFLKVQSQLGRSEKRFLVRRIVKHVLGLRRLGIAPKEWKNLLNLLKDGLTSIEVFVLVSAYQFVKFTKRGDTFFAKYIERCMVPKTK